MSPLPRINIVLTAVLAFGLLFLFIQFLSLGKVQSFTQKRVDALELSTIAPQTVVFPEAGESGKIEPVVALPSVAPAPTPTAVPVGPKLTSSLVAVSKKITTYLPISGNSFVTTENGWVNVTGSDFQLNIGDFGSGSYATWESSMWIHGGSGQVHARLFDVTNGVGVSGSEIIGSAPSATLVISGRLNFFSGNNTYRVQLYSQTSSPVEFDSGRVKIVY